MRRLILFAAALLAVIPATARGQVPAGPEFPVNSYTTGNQGVPAVATDAKGNFVVVWSGYYGIAGQRFSATGVPQGGEFVIDAAGYGSPAVASSATGRFVVVWAASDGGGDGVFGQRFDAAGAPQGGAFQVNSYTTGRQFGPAVAADASGNFVVVWQSFGQDGRDHGVFGQRFDASGVPQGDEFQVNSAFTGYFGDQFSPAVDSDATGNFVVVWTNISAVFGPQTRGIFGQRFDAAGDAQGGEFHVNMSTSQSVGSPHVALAGNGNFVVVWAFGFGFPIPDVDVMGRRFVATGTPLDAEFRVNVNTIGRHTGPSVDADLNGNFVVAWEGSEQDGGYFFETAVLARRFDASGVGGADFRVNSYITGNQQSPAVASTPDENFVVVWESSGQDGDGFGVFGQRYGDLIFRNGFEPAF